MHSTVPEQIVMYIQMKSAINQNENIYFCYRKSVVYTMLLHTIPPCINCSSDIFTQVFCHKSPEMTEAGDTKLHKIQFNHRIMYLKQVHRR